MREIPLHPAQHDVYTDQLVNGNSPLYNVGGYICLKGPLDHLRFLKMVNDAPGIFDAFTMRFNLEAADFSVYFNEAIKDFQVDLKDLSSEHDPAARAFEWMQNDFNQPLKITPDTVPYKQVLIKLSDGEYWFYGKYHHLVMDGYGFIVWVKYLADKYRAIKSSNEVEFTFPSYKAEVEKAAADHQSERYQQLGNYWKQKFAEPSVRLLREKNVSLSQAGLAASSFGISLSPQQKEDLVAAQQRTGAGLLQLTIAALIIYFGKAADRQSFTFGIPVHKRHSRILRNIVGMFSGILPFKGMYRSECTVKELLKEISGQLKQDFRHQDYLLGDIVRDLKMAPGEKLFDVEINYEPFNFQLDFGSEIKASIFQLAANVSRSPLQITWQDHGDQQPLQLQIDYGNRFFSPTQIQFFADSLLSVIGQFSKGDNTPISEIDILTEPEKTRLKDFSSQNLLVGDFSPLHSFFERQVLLTPDSVALLMDDHVVSYRQLNERSNQVAHFLLSQSAQPETCIPICLERGADMVAGILGILKAGAAYVPIDPAYPAERIQYMLEDSAAKLVLSNKKCMSIVSAGSDVQPIALDEPSLFQSMPVTDPVVNIAPAQLAYVIYTSGSTGKPKGVMIEHRNTSAFMHWCRQEFARDSFDIVYAATSVCFDLSIFELFYPLSFGKPVRILENGLQIGRYLSTDTRVLINTVPAVVENLLKEHGGLPNVSSINMAGEPVPQTVLAGLDTEKIAVRNLYGPTEDTTYSTVFRLRNHQPVLIGKPISGSYVYILNQGGQLVPLGETGEICLGGAGIARGYLHQPHLTDQKFINDPFSDSADSRLYKTGDLGRWTSMGDLEYLGRHDNQVKLRGYRIELGEIETVLQQSGLVQNAVAVVKNDKADNKILVGYFTAGQPVNASQLVSYLKSRLPDYMVPMQWVKLDKFPLTQNGKINRALLPDPVIETANSHYNPATSTTEKLLVQLWQQVLEIDRVGIDDNFYELGGHSIRAIQVITRLHRQTDIKPGFDQFMANATIRQFAKVIEGMQKSAYAAIGKAPKSELYELSHAQKRIWVLSQLPGGSVTFNGPGAFGLEGKIQVDLIEDVFKSLIERHEVLRTQISDADGQPKQKILLPGEVNFKIEGIDLSGKKEQSDLLNNLYHEEAVKEFDLSKAPLFRAVLITLQPENHILLFIIHHIISDGWSKQLLIEQFISAYTQLANQKLVEADTPSIQYKDYAFWQQSVYKEQGGYWKKVLAGDLPVLQLPLDFKRPAVMSFSGEQVQRTVPASLKARLNELAALNGTTLNNLMVALYGMLVCHHSNQQQVVIGSLASGRSHQEFENLVGVFINFLPIRLEVDRKKPLFAYLKEAHHVLANAYDNQDYPFDKMVEDLSLKRDFSRNPIFDTMVNFHSENSLQNEYIITADDPDRSITIRPLKQFQENQFQSNLDCKLDIESINSELQLHLSFNAKLFRSQRMGVFLDQYVELLNAVAASSVGIAEDYLLWPVEKGVADHPLTTSNPETNKKLDVFICSSFVCEPVQEYIDYWATEYELTIQVEFAPYNQVFQQLLFADSKFNTNKGVNVLLIRIEDWLRDKKNLPANEQISFLNETKNELENALQKAVNDLRIPLVIGMVPLNDSSDFTIPVQEHIVQLSRQIETWLQRQPSINILNLNDIADLYEVADIFDAKADELGHLPFSQEYFAALGTFLTRKIRSYISKVYKVLVLDCDNTLWKGVCGELGSEGVEINEHFLYWQRFLLTKYREGFLLALCSKNNEPDVWEVFENNKSMLLKREHIAAHRINWMNKSDSIAELAEELNVGIDSFIFVDDSAFEIDHVETARPEVLCLQLPEEDEELKAFAEHTWQFDVFVATVEDKMRNAMYRTEKTRKLEQENHSSYNEFLQSLHIKVTTRPIEERDIDRALQLGLRTNQFNMNGIRPERELIKSHILSEQRLGWMIDVADRFGDYGTVGLLLGTHNMATLQLQTFLLSCRVLGRGVEKIIWQNVHQYCVTHSLNDIMLRFQTTSKNKPFEIFLASSGVQWSNDSQNWHSTVKYSIEEIGI